MAFSREFFTGDLNITTLVYRNPGKRDPDYQMIDISPTFVGQAMDPYPRSCGDCAGLPLLPWSSISTWQKFCLTHFQNIDLPHILLKSNQRRLRAFQRQSAVASNRLALEVMSFASRWGYN